MLQHPGNGISLESYDEEVGFCALMHIYKAKRMERASPAKGMTECLSNYFSSCSFLSSTTPSWVPLPLCRCLTGLSAQCGVLCAVVTCGRVLERCFMYRHIAANRDAQGSPASASSHSPLVYFTKSGCASFVKFFVLVLSTVEVKRHKL